MEAQTDLVLLGAANPVLQACSAETRRALLERGTVRSFEAATLLFQEREPAGVVLFPLRGALQVSKTASHNRRQVMCNLDPTACGGICLLTMAARGLGDVRALEPGELLVLPRADFQQLARQDPALCQTGWSAAAECMGHLSGIVESLSFHKVAERVASMLLENTEKEGDLVRRTQAELAAEVGTTREVVARCLAGFQMDGAIRLGRGRITVLSREKLLQGA
ncbi:MAG: Crp/Fnr family transcriptional regulator [Chloroflexi bacterium]|nr:Crp/Fnr family transcriptional regulator [Chloroflexota bacterium]